MHLWPPFPRWLEPGTDPSSEWTTILTMRPPRKPARHEFPSFFCHDSHVLAPATGIRPGTGGVRVLHAGTALIFPVSRPYPCPAHVRRHHTPTQVLRSRVQAAGSPVARCDPESRRTGYVSPPPQPVGTWTYLACRVTLAPILINFSRSVVSDQCRTGFGRASLRRKLPRL